ncbi:MAG: hypothetical protein RJA98_1074 [Pseudomonadota bacterium]|jgi:hypothetical protein
MATTSQAERIAARIEALLKAGPTDAVGVWADRQDAFTREESPALLVECIDEDSSPLGGAAGFGGRDQVDSDTLRVAVVSVVRGDDWRARADALRCQAHALVMADQPLQALTRGIRRDRAEWKGANADQPFGYVAQVYLIRYHSKAFDLRA